MTPVVHDARQFHRRLLRPVRQDGNMRIVRGLGDPGALLAGHENSKAGDYNENQRGNPGPLTLPGDRRSMSRHSSRVHTEES